MSSTTQSQNKTYGNVKIESPTAIAHLEYDPDSLPLPPSDKWTRFVCISDTHGRTFPVPPGDVLLHSGDLTQTGTYGDFEVTMNWLYSLPHPTKIIIAGNHDLTLHRGWYDQEYTRWHRRNGKQDIDSILELLKGPKATNAGIVYLQDTSFEFSTKPEGKKWTVYGSPCSPTFCDWAFNYDRGVAAERLVSKFPKTDILLTHGPPANILDTVYSGEHVGCETLTAHLPLLRPRLHLFGHIHEAHGALIQTYPLSTNLPSGPTTLNATEVDSKADRTVFVNAANWPTGNRVYRVGGKLPFGGPGCQPVVVDLLDTIPA